MALFSFNLREESDTKPARNMHHTLWRWGSVLLLIRPDWNRHRNNKSGLGPGLRPRPLLATHNNSGTSTRHLHQLWRSLECHPVHPIRWKNHCFTTISFPLFIWKPGVHMLAHKKDDCGWTQEFSQATSRYWFIHDPNGVLTRTGPEPMLIKQTRENTDQCGT